MLSIEYINSENRRVARQSREKGQTPIVFFDKADVAARFRQLPNLGDHRPKGWRLEEERMVDSSGFGAENEPALTVGGFQSWLNEHVGNADTTSGFGIISAGQFQVVVGRFVKRAPKPAAPYQPKTGQPCSCRPGAQRDNCPACEGTGQQIDFAAIRARK